MMTIADDFNPPHKIKGILILKELLENVDPALLKRTGIDALLFSVRCPISRNLCKSDLVSINVSV